MALEVREDRGIFEILGNVTSQNLGALQVYFENALENHESIVINLEYTDSMDTSSALFFEGIYRKGAGMGRIVSIVGRQNKDILEIMSQTKTDYILSTDRV